MLATCLPLMRSYASCSTENEARAGTGARAPADGYSSCASAPRKLSRSALPSSRREGPAKRLAKLVLVSRGTFGIPTLGGTDRAARMNESPAECFGVREEPEDVSPRSLAEAEPTHVANQESHVAVLSIAQVTRPFALRLPISSCHPDEYCVLERERHGSTLASARELREERAQTAEFLVRARLGLFGG
jgi:hypothetical protein